MPATASSAPSSADSRRDFSSSARQGPKGSPSGPFFGAANHAPPRLFRYMPAVIDSPGDGGAEILRFQPPAPSGERARAAAEKGVPCGHSRHRTAPQPAHARFGSPGPFRRTPRPFRKRAFSAAGVRQPLVAAPAVDARAPENYKEVTASGMFGKRPTFTPWRPSSASLLRRTEVSFTGRSVWHVILPK